MNASPADDGMTELMGLDQRSGTMSTEHAQLESEVAGASVILFATD